MSFSFNFSGDDIEDDPSSNDSTDLVEEMQNHTISEQNIPITPQRHTLKELLSSLPSQISYNYLDIPLIPSTGQNERRRSTLAVPRRSLFDIRQQLMAEAESEDDDRLLRGLDQGDLSAGVYEGGFKTWECAVDLASLVADGTDDGVGVLHVIELGAGSAIPSLVCLMKRLGRGGEVARRVHFTLCDYNEDVLRLVTAVNVFLTCQLHGNVDGDGASKRDVELDLEDVDDVKINACLEVLEQNGITFDFISGAWGDEFLGLLRKDGTSKTQTLILASETIYSPASTKIFSKSLLDILRLEGSESKAWVAAKKVYFGVGGGVEDFSKEVFRLNGTISTLLDVKSAGVGRIVLCIKGVD